MATVTFVQPDGSKIEVPAPAGTSVMKAAISSDVKGIVADCGGSLACATCHVYVEPADADKFAAVTDEEDEMLDEVVCERLENSRLSCQLVFPETSDPITITLPEEQW